MLQVVVPSTISELTSRCVLLSHQTPAASQAVLCHVLCVLQVVVSSTYSELTSRH